MANQKAALIRNGSLDQIASGDTLTDDAGVAYLKTGDANNYVHPNHSGDVTSVADGAQTITNNAVTLAKMATIATSSFLGRATTGTGDPEVLSAAQVRTILNVENGSTADQTDAEIEIAYNNQVPVVTQIIAEAGVDTTVRRWTAERVKQAILALSPGSSGSHRNTISFSYANIGASATVDVGRAASTIKDYLVGAAGEVHKLALRTELVITAGTITAKVTKNGTPVVGMDSVGNSTTQTRGQNKAVTGVTLVANDLVGCQLTTDASFAPAQDIYIDVIMSEA